MKDDETNGATVMWLIFAVTTVLVLGAFVFFLGALMGWW